MGGIGTGELIMLGIIIVIVFSASRMGALGNALGRFVYSFKKASGGEGFIDVKPTRVSSGKPERVVEGERIIKPPTDQDR